MSNYNIISSQNDLYHHGIIGQKWGVRRYQNADGTLTNAGKRRYGENLDINDKSRKNIAKIRLGEARRRLDVATNNNSTNKVRIAELRQRERSAKYAVKSAKSIDRGIDKASKGQTILSNNRKKALAYTGAAAANLAFKTFTNMRLSDLKNQGRYTNQHKQVVDSLNRLMSIGTYGVATAYAMKKNHDNNDLRKYNSARITGNLSTTRTGSTEYKDVVKRRNSSLKHSQGPWKEHKYVKVENGHYVYKGDKSDVTASNNDLSKIDTSNVNIDKNNMVDIANDKLDDAGTAQIAKLLVGGLYGDAKNAKKMLGKNYESIAKKADELVEKGEMKPEDVKKGLEQANILIAALGKTNVSDKKNNNKETETSAKKNKKETKETKKTRFKLSEKAPSSVKHNVKKREQTRSEAIYDYNKNLKEWLKKK